MVFVRPHVVGNPFPTPEHVALLLLYTAVALLAGHLHRINPVARSRVALKVLSVTQMPMLKQAFLWNWN